MKIGIAGNCQMWAMERCIAALLPDAEIVSVRFDRGDGGGDLQALADALLSCDALLTQFVPPGALGPLATDLLVPRARRAVALPSLGFDGLHPDCVYVFGPDGQPKLGPMFPYNSALCLAAYLEDLSADKAFRLFNAYTYGRLGYFDAYGSALDWLGRDVARLGFDLPQMVAASPPVFMHTTNHPKIGLVFALAQAALRRVDLPFADAAVPEDPLDHMGTWMVFPEIAARLGIPAVEYFEARGRRFGLRDMVEGLYKAMPGWAEYTIPASVHRARAFIRQAVKGMASPQGLSADEVRLAYRMILGRDCESGAAAERDAKAFGSLAALRRGLLSSAEFREGFAEIA